MSLNSCAAIILAAGKGTRMKSRSINKVALNLQGRPIISYIVSRLQTIGLPHIIVVVGFAANSVRAALGDRVIYARQSKFLGTGHAFKCGLRLLPKGVSTVISLYGDDSAFYPGDVIRHLVSHHEKSNAAVTLLTVQVPDPTGLGRIIRDNHDKIQAIVEEKVATDSQKRIREINTGLYCFKVDFIKKAIDKIQKNPVSHEYYLTDIVQIARQSNNLVEAVKWPDPSVWHGVNTPGDLAAAMKKLPSPV